MDHPFILKLHCSFQDPGNLYMLTDYEPGGCLFFQLSKRNRFAEKDIIFYAAELILALDYLHS